MTDETITLLKQLRTFHNGTYAKAIDEAIAFAEPKKGTWIRHKWTENTYGILISKYECSCCHTWGGNDSNFCPNCGEDMRG